MRHKKVYLRGGGVKLKCGRRTFAVAAVDTNWSIKKCRFCGMDVQTIGHSPETTRIYEGASAPTLLEIFKGFLLES